MYIIIEVVEIELLLSIFLEGKHLFFIKTVNQLIDMKPNGLIIPILLSLLSILKKLINVLSKQLLINPIDLVLRQRL